jgi:site-specific DNA-methyltransferase (adenine-specific)/modification methylase
MHKIILGDALIKLDTLNKKLDCVLVDPPYNTANKNTKNLKGRKARSSDFGPWDYFNDMEYMQFTKAWISKIPRVLKNNGNFILFCKLEYVSDIRRIYEQCGFKHHATIIWHKTNPAPQIRKNGFLSSCEAILWSTLGYNHDKISYTFNFSTQKEMHNFIETPICMGKERTIHPTQKPQKVIEHLLKIFSNEGDTILDCFAGSGTLTAACDKMNRNSICIEKNLEYFELCLKRLDKVKGLKIIR